MTALYAIHTEFLDGDGGNASISLAEPGGLAVGDLLLAHLLAYNPTSVTVPGQITGFTDVIASYGNAAQLGRLTRRIADGSEGPTYTSAVGTTQYNDGAMLRIVGSHPTTPIDGSNNASGSASNANFPAVTTTAANCLAIAFVISSGTMPATPPSGWLTLDLYGFGGNANGMYYKWCGAAGSSTGTSNLNWTTSGLYNIAVVTIAPATQTNPYLIGAGAQVVGTTTATPTYPTGYTAVADDYAVVHLGETISDTGEFTTPTNWTKAGTQLNEVGAQDIRCSVYYKKLTASEALPAWTGDTADGMSVQCQIWRGVDTTTPMDATAVPSEANAAATFTPTGITTVTNNAAVVAFVTTSDDNAINLTTPGNFGLVYGGVDYDTTTGADHADAAAAKTQATAGAVTAPTFNQVLVGTDQWAAVVIALRPATTSQTLTVPTATLTLSRVVPAVAGSGAASFTVPVRNISLSGVTPDVDAGAVSITIPTAVIDVSAVNVAVAGTGARSFTLPVASLDISGVNVAVHLGHFLAGVSGSARYLLDENGQPWFGAGDTAWSMMVMWDEADITEYLTDRASKGVNFVLCNAVEHHFGDNAPNNINNEAPFTGTAFQTGLNEDYWVIVDHAVSEAYRLGITLLICPAYLGFEGSDEGWDTEIVAATNVQMGTYGTTLGNRYAAWPNIAWLVGHDQVPSATELAREAAMSDAIQAVTAHLVTVGTYEALGSGAYEGSSVNYDFDTVYDSDEAPLNQTLAGWNATPTMPMGFLEGTYEGERGHANTYGNEPFLRYQLWGPLCAGASYAIFGNNPIWHGGCSVPPALYSYSNIGTWQDALDSPGSDSLAVFAQFLASVGDNWALMAPDTTDTFLTSGEGSGSTQAAARFDNDGVTGVLAIVYRPHGGSSTLTLDLTEFTGVTGVTVRKLDPANGAYTTVGSFTTASSQSIGSLGTNSAGDTDWVLVVEGAAVVPVPTATITLNRVAPTVAATGARTFTVPVATVTLSRVAPALAGVGGVSFTVPVATLTLSRVAPSVAGSGARTSAVPVATLTLSPVVPAVAPSGAVTFAVPTATLTLSRVAPSVSPTGAAAFVVPVATVTLARVAPALVGSGVGPVTVATAVVTLSGVAPSPAGAGVGALVVPVGLVALDALDVAVTVLGGPQAVPVPSAVLTLSRVAPVLSAVGVGAFVVPTATLVLSRVVPVVSGVGGVTFTLPVATLTLSGFAPSIGAGAVTFTVPTAVLTLSRVAVVVSPGGVATFAVPVATITLSRVAPSVAAVGVATFAVPVATITLQSVAPVVSVGIGLAIVVVPVGVLDLSGVPLAIGAAGAVTFPIAAAVIQLLAVAVAVGHPSHAGTLCLTLDAPCLSLTLDVGCIEVELS